MGIARARGAVLFSVLIGLLMHLIFREEEEAKAAAQVQLPEPEVPRPLWQNLLYFATLTEIPILQGLIGAGMGKGPALALLLAGPALSLPNMLVIRSIIGTKKTVVFVALVVVMATISGVLFGLVG